RHADVAGDRLPETAWCDLRPLCDGPYPKAFEQGLRALSLEGARTHRRIVPRQRRMTDPCRLNYSGVRKASFQQHTKACVRSRSGSADFVRNDHNNWGLRCITPFRIARHAYFWDW